MNPRLLRPSHRLRRVLQRMSRQRFLNADEVGRIGLALARRACPANPHAALRYAAPEVCFTVGMLNGMPPAWPGEPQYMDVLRLNTVSRNGASVEIELLRTTLYQNKRIRHEEHR